MTCPLQLGYKTCRSPGVTGSYGDALLNPPMRACRLWPASLRSRIAAGRGGEAIEEGGRAERAADRFRRPERRDRLGETGASRIGEAGAALVHQRRDADKLIVRPSQCDLTLDQRHSSARATRFARTGFRATVRAAAVRCCSSSATEPNRPSRQISRLRRAGVEPYAFCAWPSARKKPQSEPRSAVRRSRSLSRRRSNRR